MSTLPKSLIEALRSRTVIPFVGAGESKAVKDKSGKDIFPTWDGLLDLGVKRLRAEKLDDDADLAAAMLKKGRKFEAAKEMRDGLGTRWFPFLKEIFAPSFDDVEPGSLELARAIWRLGSPLAITTNYDRVLQWANDDKENLKQWTVSDKVNLAGIHKERGPIVWHLHGSIDRPEEIILTSDGYELLYPAAGGVEAHHAAAQNTLRSHMTARSLLFIGFGMEENIRGEIAWVRKTFAGAGEQHFVLVRTGTEEKDRRAKRQEWEKLLDGLSVQPVEFTEFGQPLLELLKEMGSHAAKGGGVARRAPVRVAVDSKPYLD